MNAETFLKSLTRTDTSVKNLNNIGAVGFNTGATDKNEDRTPSYYINKGLEMYETNPIVQSGVDTLAEFIFPNKKIKIRSKDPKTKQVLEEWHEKRVHLLEDFKTNIKISLCTGNSYFQIVNDEDLKKECIQKYNKFTEMVKVNKHNRQYIINNKETLDSEIKINNFFIFSDPSRIYVNPDSIDGLDAYILQLAPGTAPFMFNGKRRIPTFHRVKYMKNNWMFYLSVYGIMISKWELSHIKIGFSRDNIYGRGVIMAGIDSHNTMMEIISSWDTISKTRQKNQIIITPTDSFGGVLDQKTLEDLSQKLEDNKDKSYKLFGVPMKLVSQEIEVAGKYDLMIGVFDVLRRMLMVSLIPNFLTPWSESATTQGADASLPPFKQRLKSMQHTFEKAYTQATLSKILKRYPDLDQTATYEFDEPQIMDDTYYINTLCILVERGLISQDDMKDYLKRIGVINDSVTYAPTKNVNNPLQQLMTHTDNQPSQQTELESFELPVTDFQDFQKKFEKASGVSAKNWKQLNGQAVNERMVRLIETPEMYKVFDGLVVVKNFEKKDLKDKQKIPKEEYFQYIKELKDINKKITTGNTQEDDAIEDLEQFVKNEFTSRFKKLLQTIDSTGTKFESFSQTRKEKFLSMTVFSKFDDIFSDFNSKIGNKIDEIMKKLGLELIKDTEVIDGEEVKVDDDEKKKLMQKRDLMIASMKSQLTGTTDGILRGIKSDLTQGIAAGQDVGDIKKAIEDKYNYSQGVAWKASRTIKNETKDALILMKLRKWLYLGFEQVEHITHISEKNCSRCVGLNHKIFKIKYLLEHPEFRIPLHPNDRCDYVVYR